MSFGGGDAEASSLSAQAARDFELRLAEANFNASRLNFDDVDGSEDEYGAAAGGDGFESESDVHFDGGFDSPPDPNELDGHRLLKLLQERGERHFRNPHVAFVR